MGDPEEGSLRSIDSTSFTDGTSRGGSRPTSSGERESRASNFSMSDDISINQIPESLPSPGPALPSTVPKSNYLLRLKKQTNKHSRSDTNDLVDNMTGINSLTQRNHKIVQMERSNSPLLQSEDNLIEVKKCESSCGSKYILKGTRSTMSISGQSEGGQSECSNQSHVNNKQQTNCKPTKIIEESEDESDLTPSEILIRNRRKTVERLK